LCIHISCQESPYPSQVSSWLLLWKPLECKRCRINRWHTAQHKQWVYCGKVVLQWESPARELELTATYRLEVDKGGEWRSSRKVTGQDNPQWPSDSTKIMA
jgi:hypothetical protein